MSAPWIAAFAALWLVVVAGAVVLLGFLRRAVFVLEAAESRLRGSSLPIGGASPGTTLPSFEVRNEHGELVRSEGLTATSAVFLFASADCQPCHSLLEQLNQTGWEFADVSLFAILNDSVEDRAIALGPGVTALYQSERQAAAAFESIATPQAFAVDSNGVVVDSRVPQSIDDLRRLAQSLEGGEEVVQSHPVEMLRA